MVQLLSLYLISVSLVGIAQGYHPQILGTNGEEYQEFPSMKGTTTSIKVRIFVV